MSRVQKPRDNRKVLVQVPRPDMLKHSYRDHTVVKATVVFRSGNIPIIVKEYAYPIL